MSSTFDVSGPVIVEVGGESRDYLAGIITADMTVVRQAGSAGKNGATLDPGSCAYESRSMYDSEPAVLRHYRHDTPLVLNWTTRDGATTAPVVASTFIDSFVGDPKAIIRLKLEPEKGTPGMSRILVWEDVEQE